MATDQDHAVGLDLPSHWEAVYRELTPSGVSWYEPEASTSLMLVESLHLDSDCPIVDVGGGASKFVDGLVSRGFSDVTVVDLSSTALDAAQKRLSPSAPVRWIQADILRWEPERHFGLWHDRAAYHFLTGADEQRRYLTVLDRTLDTPGYVILATFAEDGPPTCSGLPVSRYGIEDLTAVLSTSGVEVIGGCRDEHTTPGGVIQPFTWVIGARR